MDERIPAAQLARKLDYVLGRIRHRGDSFVVEEDGVPVARLIPVEPPKPFTLGDLVRMWKSRPPDPEFADALERVNAADVPVENRWK